MSVLLNLHLRALERFLSFFQHGCALEVQHYYCVGTQGMHFLHDRRQQILHRDLKSPNLLVDKHWHCKIADFNLSKIMDSLDRVGSSSFTSENPRWMAPEVLSFSFVLE